MRHQWRHTGVVQRLRVGVTHSTSHHPSEKKQRWRWPPRLQASKRTKRYAGEAPLLARQRTARALMLAHSGLWVPQSRRWHAVEQSTQSGAHTDELSASRRMQGTQPSHTYIVRNGILSSGAVTQILGNIPNMPSCQSVAQQRKARLGIRETTPASRSRQQRSDHRLLCWKHLPSTQENPYCPQKLSSVPSVSSDTRALS